MTDFDKAKIGFALALLGVVFAVQPLVGSLLASVLQVFSLRIPIRYFVVAFVGLLSLTVYVYALDFLVERPQSWLRKTGNVLYAVSLAIPLLVPVLWLVNAIGSALLSTASTVVMSIGQSVLSIAGAVLGALFSWSTARRLGHTDEVAIELKLSTDEAGHIRRATEMLSAGHYDLAIVEAFRAVESAMLGALWRRGQSIRPGRPGDLVSAARQAEVLPTETLGLLVELRAARNRAVHGDGQFDRQFAEARIQDALRILGRIRGPTAEDDAA